MNLWTIAHGWPGQIGWKRASRPDPPKTMRPNIVFSRHAIDRYWERVLPQSIRKSQARKQLRELATIVPEIRGECPKWATNFSSQPDDIYWMPSEHVVFPLRFRSDGRYMALTCLSQSMFF